VRSLIIVALLAGLAHGDSRSDAEQFFRLGEKAYQTQNYGAAAENFERAYQLVDLPEIGFSAAQAYRRLYRIDNDVNHLVRALELYRNYVKKLPDGRRLGDAADAIAELDQELDRRIKAGASVSAQVAAEHTQVELNVTFAGARTTATTMQEVADTAPAETVAIVATVDGAAVKPFALVNVAPGKHVLRAEAPGYFPREKAEIVAQGSAMIVNLVLDPKPAKISVKTEDGAKILLDGRRVDGTELSATGGHHLVTILHRGREPVQRELDVANGQTLAVDAPLSFTTRRRVVPWALGATIGASALALAATTGALLRDHSASNLHDQIEMPGDQPPSVRAEYNNDLVWRDRFTTLALTTGILALALGGTTAVLYYGDNPGPEGVHAGAMLSGTF
jgi:hypothetical protein